MLPNCRPDICHAPDAMSELLIEDLLDASHDIHDARMELTEPLERRMCGRHPDERQRLGGWGGGINQPFVQVLKLARLGRRDNRFHTDGTYTEQITDRLRLAPCALQMTWRGGRPAETARSVRASSEVGNRRFWASSNCRYKNCP
jgi:hypothetical protein